MRIHHTDEKQKKRIYTLLTVSLGISAVLIILMLIFGQ